MNYCLKNKNWKIANNTTRSKLMYEIVFELLTLSLVKTFLIPKNSVITDEIIKKKIKIGFWKKLSNNKLEINTTENDKTIVINRSL